MSGRRPTPLARRLAAFERPRRRPPLAALFKGEAGGDATGGKGDDAPAPDSSSAAVSHDAHMQEPEAALARHEAETPGEETSQQALIAAFAEGRRAGLMEARAGFEAQLARLRAEFGIRLEAERRAAQAALADTLARDLAARIDAGLSELQGTLFSVLAEVLRPVLAEAAREQALVQLAARLDRLLREEEGIELRVRGPKALIRALKARLSGRLPDEACAEDETMAEIEVMVHETVIRTAISQWAANLREAPPAPEEAER